MCVRGTGQHLTVFFGFEGFSKNVYSNDISMTDESKGGLDSQVKDTRSLDLAAVVGSCAVGGIFLRR